jgi:hypothetical protein
VDPFFRQHQHPICVYLLQIRLYQKVGFFDRLATCYDNRILNVIVHLLLVAVILLEFLTDFQQYPLTDQNHYWVCSIVIGCAFDIAYTEISLSHPTPYLSYVQ